MMISSLHDDDQHQYSHFCSRDLQVLIGIDAHVCVLLHFQNAHTQLSLAFCAKMDSKMKIIERPSVVFAGVGKSVVSTKFQ